MTKKAHLNVTLFSPRSLSGWWFIVHFTQWLACKQKPFIIEGSRAEACGVPQRPGPQTPSVWRKSSEEQRGDDCTLAGGDYRGLLLTARDASLGTRGAVSAPEESFTGLETLGWVEWWSCDGELRLTDRNGVETRICDTQYYIWENVFVITTVWQVRCIFIPKLTKHLKYSDF